MFEAIGKWNERKQQEPQQFNWRGSRIQVVEGMDAQLVYSALENSLKKFERDLRTRYDNDPQYCTEDDVFLRDAIERIRVLLSHLKSAHRLIVTRA